MKCEQQKKGSKESTADAKTRAPCPVANDVPKPAEPTADSKIKPIVLSLQRYNKLVSTATQEDKKRVLKETEKERSYKEYLKKTSDAIVAKMPNVQRTKASKVEELERKKIEQYQIAKAAVQKAKENDEKVRQVAIARAKNYLASMKEGPRQLKSAALQAEVLRARNVQCDIIEDFKKAQKKQDCIDIAACQGQNAIWLGESKERKAEAIARAKELQQTLKQAMADNATRRANEKRKVMVEDIVSREKIEKELKEQIEKEQKAMEEKRATMRKTALDAMVMLEQRRMRDSVIDELEDRLCCVYNTGKRELDTLKTATENRLKAERQQLREIAAEKVVGHHEAVLAVEEQRLRRDIDCQQLKFTAEEQARVNKERKAKQARIEAHLEEQRRRKAAVERCREKKRFELAQRIKNSEINVIFNERSKQENWRQQMQKRTSLQQQIAAKEAAQKQALAVEEQLEGKNYYKEDQFFFEKAESYMEDAKRKQRPLYPFIKVVNEYKRDNNIDCDRRLPPHLVSKVQVGDAVQTNAKVTPTCNQNDKQSIILNRCEKIKQIIRSTGNHLKPTYSGFAATLMCKQPDAGGHAANPLTAIKALEREACTGMDDPVGTSVKRYSIDELRTLNPNNQKSP